MALLTKGRFSADPRCGASFWRSSPPVFCHFGAPICPECSFRDVGNEKIGHRNRASFSPKHSSAILVLCLALAELSSGGAGAFSAAFGAGKWAWRGFFWRSFRHLCEVRPGGRGNPILSFWLSNLSILIDDEKNARWRQKNCRIICSSPYLLLPLQPKNKKDIFD